MKKIAIIGYSGHAYVVIDSFLAMGYEILGYFEKSKLLNNPFEIEYLGNEQHYDLKTFNDVLFFTAIGSNVIREKINNSLLLSNLEMGLAISPSASVSNTAKIESATLIGANACLNAFSIVKFGVIINTGAIVEHECHIEAHAHVGPGAVLAGNVYVGEKSFIGANSVIKQNIKVGKNSIIGAGSVVLTDVPENQVWIGNPAKMLKANV